MNNKESKYVEGNYLISGASIDNLCEIRYILDSLINHEMFEGDILLDEKEIERLEHKCDSISALAVAWVEDLISSTSFKGE